MERIRMTKKEFLIALICVALVIVVGSFMYSRSIPAPELPLTESDKTELLYNRAIQFLNKGDEAKAVNGFIAAAGSSGNSKYAEMALRRLAAVYLQKGDDDKTMFYYQRLLKSYPDIKDASKVRAKSESLRMKTLLSSGPEQKNAEYVVKPGDSLYVIAKKFNTTVALMKKMNDLKSDTIRPGQKLNISVAKFSILVDKSENILVLKKDGEVFKTYSVATGKDNSTPVGVVTIVDKMVKPVWTKPGVGLVMPDSEEYELGERWLPVSIKGYGIHGTRDEASIGKQLTAGCVRMRNEDVIELYDLVPVGTEVEIVD
ncbi:MAG: L,D-transpeptidase family protein [Candidatus Omnitrophica bacterium]|nr:L,D-transpeptidase family protein [Candidatus Omnitrophota bacterium]MBU1128225.1 L,D-transpeptidase family protein [Candidatus Omnitrophota bacterium]MBU1784968.1 L,D-transpeptidase family protein [Candidatus Omnitrophota bacterium]MBU1851803.1 L,D-transpeptidase family protein [Candidatus Omnitrophota bacterium]